MKPAAAGAIPSVAASFFRKRFERAVALMQRLKKALRHLRAIQHDAILIVAGAANKHRPRRVLREGHAAAHFSTLRGFRRKWARQLQSSSDFRL
ncbi:hypothetical protein [Shinella zoogloeoides]|uniref:hypothetical protein n=1 Tax=Shinella zoogloeoides TaxID=352475 RepID=UPI00273FEE7B|nr:hypothetical protein [Shinella zoogloeoides]WLR94856.1 hypothetical protein Q9316_20300 [Shinella zoogloeoides]